jgi:hypothetical protein
MRFGRKDICIVSFIGILTGCYVVNIGQGILDSLPLAPYVMISAGFVALLGIILMLRPLIKEKSPE